MICKIFQKCFSFFFFSSGRENKNTICKKKKKMYISGDKIKSHAADF